MTARNTFIVVSLGLLLLGLLVLALRPAPVLVSVSVVERGEFEQVVEEEGQTRLRQPYLVSAPVDGYLRRVQPEPGQRVTAGETLFVLEARPTPALDARSRQQAQDTIAAAEARLAAAEAELATRRLTHSLAETEYRRNLPLFRRGLLAAGQMDAIRARRDTSGSDEQVARSRVEVARFELEAARAALQVVDGQRSPQAQPGLSVPAPVDGVITRRLRRNEGPINSGEPVLEIGDLSRLEVRVDMLSMDAVRLRPGMPVILMRWGGDGDLRGQVRQIEPGGFTRVSALGVDEQRVTVRVDITSEPGLWSQLGDGYRVEARFILWQGQDIVQVPTSALFRHESGWALFVVSEGRARLRPVTTGRRSGLRTQILDGVQPGMRVIHHPGDRIRDGVRVRAEPDG